MAKDPEYRRLPGRGIKRNGIATAARCRLWLGTDHLLCSDYAWYSEDYKRFYYRDIQAIVIRKTAVGKITSMVLAGLSIPLLFAGVISSDGWQIFWFIVSGTLLLSLLIHSLYGPTCVTHLRTAVQTEDLPSLRRLWRARKVLARLRPLIVAAQGELNPVEIPARMAELAQPPVAATQELAPQPPIAFQPPADLQP